MIIFQENDPPPKYTHTHSARSFCIALRAILRPVASLRIRHVHTATNTLQHTHCNRHTARHLFITAHGAAARRLARNESRTHCNTLQHTATHCDTLQHTSCMRCCSSSPEASLARCVCVCVSEREVVWRSGACSHSFSCCCCCCSVLQCVAVCCRVLQGVAMRGHAQPLVPLLLLLLCGASCYRQCVDSYV